MPLGRSANNGVASVMVDPEALATKNSTPLRAEAPAVANTPSPASELVLDVFSVMTVEPAAASPTVLKFAQTKKVPSIGEFADIGMLVGHGRVVHPVEFTPKSDSAGYPFVGSTVTVTPLDVEVVNGMPPCPKKSATG